MRVFRAGEKTIELFDSIDNLPAERESKMNYYLLSESGIGHTWESIDSHLNSIQMAAVANDKEGLFGAIENLKIGFMHVASGYNAEKLTWVCLIKSVDGKDIVDISGTALKALAEEFIVDGTAEQIWGEAFKEIKKKLPTSWLSISQPGHQEEDLMETLQSVTTLQE